MCFVVSLLFRVLNLNIFLRVSGCCLLLPHFPVFISFCAPNITERIDLLLLWPLWHNLLGTPQWFLGIFTICLTAFVLLDSGFCCELKTLPSCLRCFLFINSVVHFDFGVVYRS